MNGWVGWVELNVLPGRTTATWLLSYVALCCVVLWCGVVCCDVCIVMSCIGVGSGSTGGWEGGWAGGWVGGWGVIHGATERVPYSGKRRENMALRGRGISLAPSREAGLAPQASSF